MGMVTVNQWVWSPRQGRNPYIKNPGSPWDMSCFLQAVHDPLYHHTAEVEVPHRFLGILTMEKLRANSATTYNCDCITRLATLGCWSQTPLFPL